MYRKFMIEGSFVRNKVSRSNEDWARHMADVTSERVNESVIESS